MSYTGVRVIEVRPELINQLYKNKNIEADFDARRTPFNENEYVVIKDSDGKVESALTRANGGKLSLLPAHQEALGIKPRNKEQKLAMNALLDDSIQVVLLTGSAGTGKSLLALAAALQKMEEKKYNRIILTKPMSQVGKYDLGILPGEVEDKFGPYLDNYLSNIEHLLHGKHKNINSLLDAYRMEFKPLQLIRGASWSKALILADEVQVLGADEMVALGTRVGEDSKIIIMGDLAQNDEKIAKEKTGIYTFINSKLTMESPLVASIDLWKNERSPVSELFAKVFER